MKKFFGLAAITMMGPLLSATVASAAPVSFSGSSGVYSASAIFDVSGSNLLVTLTNTSAGDIMTSADLLTALFFTITGDPLLTRTSVVLAGGSIVEHPVSGTGTDPGGVVGGEFGYRNGLSQYGANQGISNSGLGIFGSGDLFPGTNLSDPASIGKQYGIASAGDNPATGDASVDSPQIKNSVLITLGGLPGGFSLSSIGNVTFQLGTALTDVHYSGALDPTIAAVPEPASMVLFGTGLMFVAAAIRRRRAS